MRVADVTVKELVSWMVVLLVAALVLMAWTHNEHAANDRAKLCVARVELGYSCEP